jgi:hypothetical protein
MHAPWRSVSKHVMILPEVQRAIENLGWRYVSRKGRRGSTFERVEGIMTNADDGRLAVTAFTSTEMCPVAEALGI